MYDDMDPLIGKPITTTRDRTGRQIGPARIDGDASLPDWYRQPTNEIAFPDKPVAEGARWTSVMNAPGELRMKTQVAYELVDLSDTEYVIRMSGETPIEQDAGDGVTIEGTMTESGEIRGDQNNPLLMNMHYRLVIEADVGPETAEATTTFRVESVS